MIGRRITTGITLVVLLVVLAVMAVWGFHAATAPLPGKATGSASTGPTCQPNQQKVIKYLRRSEVTVSVYNAGKISGRAQKTMDLLEQAGFKVGEVKNAPAGVKVARAAVYTTKTDDPAVELVAKAMGRNTRVVQSDIELGPGVDVMVGDSFRNLDPAAPTRIELPKPEVTCK